MCYGYDGERSLQRSLQGRSPSRRSLLRGMAGAGLGLAAVGLGSAAPAAQAVGGSKPWQRVPPGLISIQLWTVRDALWGSPGFDETLRAIADLGYPRVEQALGYFGRTAAELRAFYDSLGIEATSSHDGISGTPAALEQKLQNAVTLGQRYIVVPYLNEPVSASKWQTWAEQMNTEAAAAAAVGLRYGYHNHAHEFTTVLDNGSTPWEILTSELDPALVHLEIDLYWAVRGGIESGHAADPEGFTIDVIHDAPQRVLQYHVKDRHASDGDMADLGTGHIDFARLFRAHAVREYIVENDTPDVSPLQTAEVGYDYLRALRF
jgi:sugar phosphate isomerase/epimerase